MLLRCTTQCLALLWIQSYHIYFVDAWARMFCFTFLANNNNKRYDLAMVDLWGFWFNNGKVNIDKPKRTRVAVRIMIVYAYATNLGSCYLHDILYYNNIHALKRWQWLVIANVCTFKATSKMFLGALPHGAINANTKHFHEASISSGIRYDHWCNVKTGRWNIEF